MLTSVTDAETMQHIHDCGWHMECSYASFQAHGNPADRDAAILWMHMRDEAIQAREQAQKDAREAEIMAAIDDGLNYFAARGQADRERLAA